MIQQTGKRWDIFCRIVDNFGDIGVCWRLSQQLAHEHHLQIRLFIDDLVTASKIIQGLSHDQTSQIINNIEICSWPDFDIETHTDIVLENTVLENTVLANEELPNVVLETFCCELPSVYIQKMCTQQTIWINLEYLSAEAWVSDFHAKPSRHPTLLITKYFFFPGFRPDTGGLIREADLITKRDAFMNSISLQNEFWLNLQTSKPDPKKTALKNNTRINSIKISLFCYPQAPINNLLLALAESDQAIDLYLPIDENLTAFNDVLADFKLNINENATYGNLTIHVIPFLAQADYDSLLWACDLNFVRGEDSWIRAIWASKPFIWQPYIQSDDTHIKKITAFLEIYTHSTEKESTEISSTIYQANLAWSQSSATNNLTKTALKITASLKKTIVQEPWSSLINNLSEFHYYAEKRSNALINQPDLATKLVIFSENLAKNKV